MLLFDFIVSPIFSIIICWFVRSHCVIGVDNEVGGIDIVSLKDHVEYFWLMYNSFFHEVDDLVLLGNGMINVVVKLYLDFVFKLTGLIQKVFFFWNGKIFIVFCNQIEVADRCP